MPRADDLVLRPPRILPCRGPFQGSLGAGEVSCLDYLQPADQHIEGATGSRQRPRLCTAHLEIEIVFLANSSIFRKSRFRFTTPIGVVWT